MLYELLVSQPLLMTQERYTKKTTKCSNWYCGGTHAVLWRDGVSLEKLRAVYSEQPYNGIDCKLNTPDLKAYCINNLNIGRIYKIKGERSDIPK